LIKALVADSIIPLRPGASPPPVKIPIRIGESYHRHIGPN
jgi:hypothetical protein